MKRFRNLSSLFMALCLALLLVAGCDNSTDSGTDDGEEELKNPNPPTANHLIINAQAYGDPAKDSSIWDMDGNHTDGFYFIGIEDYAVSAGMMTGAGTAVWKQPIAYDPRYIMSVQTAGFTGAIVVGAYDSDEDGHKDQGIATLIGSDGTVQDQLAVSDPEAPVWFNGVTFGSDSIFLCVGACNVNDVSYPFLSTLYLTADATLRAGSTAILTEFPGTLFLDVVADDWTVNTQTGQISVRFYADGNTDAEADEYVTIHSLRCPVDSLGNMEIVWSRNIIGYSGLKTSIYTGKSITLADNGNLYLVGRTDINKESNPSGGGYWGGCLVASVTTGGTINWIKPIALSQYADYYYCVYTDNLGLYAAGRYSSFLNTGTQRLFGYGLLSKFDLATGDAEYHLSFGDDQYRTAFNTLHVEGTTAWAAGWTHDHVNDGGCQAWFASIDLSAPALAPDLLKHAPAGVALLDAPDTGFRHRASTGR